MPRAQNTYVCPVKEVTSAGEWTKNGLGLQNKVEGETPNTTDSYSVAANGKTLTGLFQMPTLAAGEIVMSVQAFVYGKAATTAADVEVLAKPSAIVLSENVAAWHHTAVVNEEGEVPAGLEAFSLKSIKIAGGTVYAIYLVLTTETERNRASGTPVKARTTISTAEGTAASGTVGSGALLAGRTAILYVAVAGANGATSITDPAGNTWTKDGEQKHGSTLTVQLWSSLLTTEIKEATALTLNGLPASVPVEMFLAQGVTAMVATSKVDVTAGAEGTGTELEVTTPAMRATQGDWVAVLYGTTANTVSFVASGFSGPAAMNFAQAGLSVAGGMINKPTEGATVAGKGTFGASGETAALVVAYKVLASTGGTGLITLAPAESVSGASLAMAAPTQVPLNPASSESGGSLAVHAPTQIALSPAASSSAASMSLTAPAIVTLTAAASTSSSSLAVTVPTQIPLGPGSSTSSASMSVRAPTGIPLAPAAALSSASLTVTTPAVAVTILLAPASSESGARLVLEVPTLTAPGTATLTVESPTGATVTWAQINTAELTVDQPNHVELAVTAL